MDMMDFLLRAWTLAHQINTINLDQQIGARLAQVASDVLTDHPGDWPGILHRPRRPRPQAPTGEEGNSITRPDRRRRPADPRGPPACQQGNDASNVARSGRSRTQNPAALDAIARDEAAAYFRDAEAAPHPAVHHSGARRPPTRPQ